MASLGTTVPVHSVRIYHKFKLYAFLLQGVHKLEGILEMHIVISRAMSQLQGIGLIFRTRQTVLDIMDNGRLVVPQGIVLRGTHESFGIMGVVKRPVIHPTSGYSATENYPPPFTAKAPETPLYPPKPTVCSAAPKPINSLDLRPGDMVTHKAYGRGMVISVLKMGNDALWEVAFDEKGTKMLMANTASVHMKKL